MSVTVYASVTGSERMNVTCTGMRQPEREEEKERERDRVRASVFLDIVHALVRSEDSHAPSCVFTHMSIIACGMLIYTYIQIYMSHTHAPT